jgi:eukaryotic-like serine/threonine-protein kinase
MAPAEWDQIFEIFHAARERPAGERVVLLDAACGENTVFRKAVEELLKHDDATTGFLEEPLFASLSKESRTTHIRAGQCFGRYVTVELIGRGGIGEVWSARDTDLDRPVALKFLSNEELVGLDAHQITNEAKTASALNHPGIITIYEVVHSESTFAIAMELVEGDSLRALVGKRIPDLELAAISFHIAEALAAAHAGGIVHGDIKPENILVRRDRYVKVLDFGLARKVTAETLASGLPALGTLRYMSPEQARGEPLTAASDTFSFGLVLYELTTGSHAFPGDSPLDTAHAILTSEPGGPFPAHLPPALQRLIFSMLSKSPESRPPATDVAHRLDVVRSTLESSSAVLPRQSILGWRFWAGLLAALVAITCAIAWLSKVKRDSQEFADLTIKPLTSQTGWEAAPALSPDGNSVAFTWSPQLDIPKEIYLKRVTDVEPVKLASSEGGIIGHLVWSPDGKRIAFKRQFDKQGALYSISSNGRDERKIVDLTNASPSSAIDWSPDGNQLAFSDSLPEVPEHLAIYLYNLLTGKKRQLTSPPLDIWGDSYPKFSPDGRTIAFKRVTGFWVDDIYLVPSNGGRLQRITSARRGIWGHAWMPDGQSLLVSCQRNGTIFGIWRFPLKSPSNPELVAQGGVDAINPATARHSRRVAWVNQQWDLNIYRVPASGTGHPVRLIASTQRDQDAVYAPDGRIAWISDRSGTREIWLSRQDGSNQVQVTNLNGPQVDHLRWSFDGRYLAFDSRLFGYSDIFVLECPPGSLQCSTPKALKIFPAECPGWSADSKSVYFSSYRSGKWQIWKQDLSGGKPVQITRAGGYYPNESPDGKWLYFSDRHIDSSILRVPGSRSPAFAPGGRSVLGRPYRVQQEGWAVTAREIIFIDRPALDRPAVIRAYNLATGKVRSILELAEVFLDRADIRVSVSADGKSILYARLDRSGSNVIIAEKNR